MANRIKGITVEIGGDTTGLSKALSGVNKDLRSTQSQLKDVERLLKLDPGNVELLAQKQRLLSGAILDDIGDPWLFPRGQGGMWRLHRGKNYGKLYRLKRAAAR